MSDQLASGSFVRGLWYFFGIVVAAGIFTGIAGLGLGFVAGLGWEQIHRHRRNERLKRKAVLEAYFDPAPPAPHAIAESAPPRLQLVTVASPDFPVIDGRVLRSIQFQVNAIALDFGGIRLSVTGNPVTVFKGQRFRYPEPGARDAMCALIGDRVRGVRVPSADRIEVLFDSGSELLIARSAVAVA